jgi:hypothetical protein
MTVNVRAHPTKYKGIMFRSRLEARWAIMFDLLGWRWEYEPIDLMGYLPDFVVMFAAGPVLVEVKYGFDYETLLAAASDTIDASTWESTTSDDALIVGSTWEVPHAECDGDWIAGPLRQNPAWGHEEGGKGWGDGQWITCTDCHKITIYQCTLLWRCIACGAAHKCYEYPGPEATLQEMWNEAGTRCQWNPPRTQWNPRKVRREE